MIQKLLGLILLAGAGFLAWNAFYEKSLSPNSQKAEAPKSVSFSDFVSTDLSSLRSQGHLPKEWDEIQHVSYLMHSAFQRELIGKHKISAIPENPSGRYKMEIEFIDVPDDEDPSLILQMSMMDIQTNNKVWELGRTYPLKAFLKQPSEEKPKEESPAQTSQATETNAPAKSDEGNKPAPAPSPQAAPAKVK
ncbi:MAG TPA: hypothetical protein PL182_11060 [Pseudobdellovibrionaceae bacterium]|nr:hypothetical protein [Pseudobdellovibrionaceae bacterium]